MKVAAFEVLGPVEMVPAAASRPSESCVATEM